MSAEWREAIPETERAIYEIAGYGAEISVGTRPALLIIDTTINFTDVAPKPVLESIQRFPNSCGEAAWASLRAIVEVLRAAREKSVPVVYTHGPVAKNPITLGGWLYSKSRAVETKIDDLGESFPELIEPAPEDFVLEKLRPSAFFGTPLAGVLTGMGRDSVIVCGATTSGCIRASVVDAFSSGFRVAVVAEGTFDRTRTSHLVNLFEMNQKYARVWSLEDALQYLGDLPDQRDRNGPP